VVDQLIYRQAALTFSSGLLSVRLTVSPAVSLSLCLSHRLSCCVSLTVSLSPSLLLCLSYCVYLTVSPAVSLLLCLSHRLSCCVSLTVSPTVPLSPSLPMCLAPPPSPSRLSAYTHTSPCPAALTRCSLTTQLQLLFTRGWAVSSPCRWPCPPRWPRPTSCASACASPSPPWRR
jgi:hypothetical protein